MNNGIGLIGRLARAAGTAGAWVGLGAGMFGCAAGSEPAADVVAEEIIGGVAASSPSLDAIGSLGLVDPYGTVQPFCTATLVGRETILTARHCAEIFETSEYAAYGYRVVFAIGPDGYAPTRMVEVVASTQLPPGDHPGFVGYYRDVAALHLESPLPDLTPARLGSLRDRDVGRDFAVIGYGIRDQSGNYGVRRAGTVELRAREGRIFEMMFGSYEAFREWLRSQGYYGVILDRAELERELGIAFPADDEPPADDAGTPEPPPDDGGTPDDGGMGEPGPDDGGISEPDYEAQYREIYETTYLIPEHEIYVGNTDGDAQPCHGDSGGPLVRFVNGQLRVYAVTSGGFGSARMRCDFGAVYTALAGESLEAANAARRWRDPCGDASAAGECRGDVAVRCTATDEGPRRLTRTRCALLGQTCGTGDDGQVACVDL